MSAPTKLAAPTFRMEEISPVPSPPSRSTLPTGASARSPGGFLPHGADGDGARLRALPVASWVLYDFANTIFSYVVLTRYFNEWIVIERGRPDWVVGLMWACVSLALLAGLPMLGALSDRLGRHVPLLRAFTALSVAATAALGLVGSVPAALVVGGIAIFAFQAAEAQYHPLLARVAPPERRALVSGLGIGVGYAGALVALLALGAVVPEGQNQRAFIPTAALFGAFALPCLVWVREARGPSVGRASGPKGTARRALADVVESMARARREPYGRFLVARFLYYDAVATVIAFMTVYARRTGDFSARQLTALLALATVFAVLGALAAGATAGRVGPKRALVGTVLGVAIVLLATGLAGGGAVLWVAGPLVGVALGSVSTLDRVLLLRLLPAERRGEGFGLYALVGRVSSGFGPLVLWGGTIWLLSDVLGVAGTVTASRVAVGVLGTAALLGLLVLRKVPAGAPAP
jgi:UMF1 family MFS transporter